MLSKSKNMLVKLVHNAVKSRFFELYFLFCLSWTHKWKSALVFISQLGFISQHVSWLCFTEKRALLPVFTGIRALFQHILRDAKSTKCEIKEHLWDCTTFAK